MSPPDYDLDSGASRVGPGRTRLLDDDFKVQHVRGRLPHIITL
jgi:hypothetical protein